MNRKVAIIILNWNSWRDTIACLESASLMDYQNFVSIVVDNGSSDKSIENLRDFATKSGLEIESKLSQKNGFYRPIQLIEYTRDQVIQEDNVKREPLGEEVYLKHQLILIKNEQNYGFAEGNNIGIRFALSVLKPDYILLLNSDTVVDSDLLFELVKVGESEEKIGVVGPKILYFDNPSKLNSAGCEMRNWSGLAVNVGIGETDRNQYNEIREVDCLHGSAMLIKASALEAAGLFDPDFFVLLEETEWCLRAKKAGYKLMFAPTTRIYHKEGFSGQRGCGYYYYTNRNRILLLKKHQKSLRKATYGLSVSLRIWIGTITLLVKGKPNLAMCGLKGYFNGLSVKKQSIYQKIR